MVIKPMIRNNICVNAHPEGSRLYVRKLVDYVRSQKRVEGPANVLIIGSSAGYGLATRAVAAFGAGANSLGVAFEKPASSKRPATPGWYMTEELERLAREDGLYAESLIGDAFSHEMKQNAVEKIRENMGTVDLVIYSLASGVRNDPDSGEMIRSVLKPIGESYASQTLDPFKEELKDVSIEPATQEEIDATVKVMGGEDWELWMNALLEAGVLGEGASTYAYSYIGSDFTRPIYRDGTIGRAKEHLEGTAELLAGKVADLGGTAGISVNKAVVTRASAVIPVVPLYMTILFRVMKERNLHEGPIEQMYRLFAERLYTGGATPTDEDGRIRLDDWELRDDVQAAVRAGWDSVTEENLREIADLDEYRTEFLHMHGFGFDEIDYEADVEL
jgi:enoyl-[acyl-carrier protein] reductase/trans-2-enoyl-CoA reductase (NAD+)